jgi:cold shock CspA family protein
MVRQITAMKGMPGKVKYFNNNQGFGIVTLNETGEDILVDKASSIATMFKTMYEGNVVEVEIEMKNGKKVATKVTGPNGGPIDTNSRGY